MTAEKGASTYDEAEVLAQIKALRAKLPSHGSDQAIAGVWEAMQPKLGALLEKLDPVGLTSPAVRLEVRRLLDASAYLLHSADEHQAAWEAFILLCSTADPKTHYAYDPPWYPWDPESPQQDAFRRATFHWLGSRIAFMAKQHLIAVRLSESGWNGPISRPDFYDVTIQALWAMGAKATAAAALHRAITALVAERYFERAARLEHILNRLQSESQGTEVAAKTELSSGDYRFYRNGDFWETRFEGVDGKHVRHEAGMSAIRDLLDSPWTDISPLEFDGGKNSGQKVSEGQAKADGHTSLAFGPIEECTDPETLRAARNLKPDLEARLDQAKKEGMIELQEKLQEDLDGVNRYVKAAVGVRGIRKDGDIYERALDKHRKAIGRAIAAVSLKHPALGSHLKTCIKTGRKFSYQPPKQFRWDT